VRVLITGSRDWTDEDTLREALDHAYMAWLGHRDELEKFVVVHGDARGADRLARDWALAKHRQDGWVAHEPHPANWEHFGKAGGFLRNEDMVSLGADLCLAFPLGRSPGTRGCIKLAKKAGITVKQFIPKEA
jgi:hypothetical protein